MLEYIREADLNVGAKDSETTGKESLLADVSAFSENPISATTAKTEAKESESSIATSQKTEEQMANSDDIPASLDALAQPVSVPELSIGREVTCRIKACGESPYSSYLPIS